MKLKNRKGITMISLIVTIIALVILASVTIAALTGDNGVINRAENARNEHIEAGKVESNTLKDYEDIIDSSTNFGDSGSGSGNQGGTGDGSGTGTGGDGTGDEGGSGTTQTKLDTPTIEVSGDTLTITSVTNATSYDIYVDGTLKTNITALTLDLTTLRLASGTYEITVKAKADGYIESDASAVAIYTVITKYSITASLTNAILSNNDMEIEEGNSYSATIAAEEGYKISSVTIKMGETNVTDTAYTSTTGAISISSVTGNIEITVTTTAQDIGYDAVGKVAIGDYVYFNVPYTDVFDSTKSYNPYTGWRVIDDGQTHASDETEGTGEIKLISTGTPLKYYHAGDVVKGLNGLTTGFFSTETTTSISRYYVWRVNGFETTDLAAEFNEMSSIIGKYAVGDTYIDDYTGDSKYTTTPVETENQLKVRAANLSDLNRSLERSLTSTDSLSSNGTLYYNPVGATWLASAGSANVYNLYMVYSSGSVGYAQFYNYGVRPVVTLKSGVKLTTETAKTDENGTYWEMQYIE